MRFVMPLPPNRANARWHWRTEKRLKDEYYLACDLICRKQLRSAENWERATISAKLYVWAESDWDNLVGRLKWPVDWLVLSGFIRSDSPKVLEWQMPTQEIDRKNQRVEILLNRMEKI